MRLTVGPLPAAVYWRRRLLVVGVLMLFVVMMSYACAGSDPSNAGAGAADTAGAGGAGGSALPAAGATGVARTSAPSDGGAKGREGDGTDPTPTPSAFSLPTAAATGPCTDAEMRVTVTAGATESPRGNSLNLTISIRNVGARTCQRDIGADVQELRIVQGKTVIWSSDDCNANHGTNLYRFAPDQVATFQFRWNGQLSRTGTGAVTCSASAPAPPAGGYELLGRLDEKLSEPFDLRLT